MKVERGFRYMSMKRYLDKEKYDSMLSRKINVDGYVVDESEWDKGVEDVCLGPEF